LRFSGVAIAAAVAVDRCPLPSCHALAQLHFEGPADAVVAAAFVVIALIVDVNELSNLT